jgi:hypothetical protein
MKDNENGYRKARGTMRKEKERERDETEEEGYITGGPKAGDRPRTEKEAQVGQARLAEISFALISYGRFVSSAPLH